MEEQKRTDEELLDLVSTNNINNVQIYPCIAPENFENSKIANILNENLIFKVSELSKFKEISKYISDEKKLIELLKTCDFLKYIEADSSFQYDLPENMTTFNILNIPVKLPKEKVKNLIELINLKYSRLYKSGIYWVLSSNDQETNICVQNSLRELRFEDSKVKYDKKTKKDWYKVIKDRLLKNSYQKETKNIKNTEKSEKASENNDSEAFSWRKGSGSVNEGKLSFDFNE